VVSVTREAWKRIAAVDKLRRPFLKPAAGSRCQVADTFMFTALIVWRAWAWRSGPLGSRFLSYLFQTS
jgi:hypothetical protein